MTNTPREDELNREFLENRDINCCNGDFCDGDHNQRILDVLRKERASTEHRVRTEMQTELDIAVMDTEQRMKGERMKAIKEFAKILKKQAYIPECEFISNNGHKGGKVVDYPDINQALNSMKGDEGK